MLAHDMAMEAEGTFLLRIEDIDQSRARFEWEQQIYDDLTWLGLSWEQPVVRQSERLPIYQKALDQLWSQELIYPCSCNRRDILAAASAPQEGATMGPDGVIYPGTCRSKARPKERGDQVLRLDIAKATESIEVEEELLGIVVAKDSLVSSIGDVVLSRKDMGTSYHLSVVIDDFDQGVTDVVRGEDLKEATPIHVVLQKLLGFPTPRYHHHKLIRDENGKRLAKRDDARAISKYRSEGATPNDIRRLVGLSEV